MNLYVGITDDRWFRFLSELDPPPGEVNFWRPKSQNQFRALEPGELFLFKLHAPLHYIVGGGVYAKHTFFPIRWAWDAFETSNGASDQREFTSRILEYRGRDSAQLPLGCTILTQPFFWPRELWLPMPEDWPKSGAMVGKSYDTQTPLGAKLWADVCVRLQDADFSPGAHTSEPPSVRFGPPKPIEPRLGQGAFRAVITDNYSRRCAMTGEKTLPALEAAHIRAYSEEGPHSASNGILLRSDLHNLFDQGYLTVTMRGNSDYRVEVSRRIKEEWNNGREYYALHGRPLTVLPIHESARPAREYLEWHNRIFKG